MFFFLPPPFFCFELMRIGIEACRQALYVDNGGSEGRRNAAVFLVSLTLMGEPDDVISVGLSTPIKRLYRVLMLLLDLLNADLSLERYW